MSPVDTSCSGTPQKNPPFGDFLCCVPEKQGLPLSVPTARSQGAHRHPCPGQDSRTKVPGLLPSLPTTPAPLSSLVSFLFSLPPLHYLQFAPPSLPTSWAPPTPIHQSEIREAPLPSGETSSEPAAPPMRPEVLEQTEAGRALHPTPEDTPLYPDPYQTPSFHFSIRDTQLPGVGLPASCSPWRVKRAVSLLWLAGGGCH